MNFKQQIPYSSPKSRKFSLKPTSAWAATIGLFSVSLIGLAIGAGSIISLAFPLGAFMVGIFLYQKYPLLYVGFTWWMWFLCPLVKRLIDYKSGYGTFGSLTLSAGLVTSISFVTLWKHLPRYITSLSARDGLPFILCIGSVVYAFAVGLIVQSPVQPRYAFLSIMNWLAPICFGFHLFINWREYPRYRQNMQRIFYWGAVVMGIYGIIQFFLVPGWERFHVDILGDDFSLGWYGTPEPMQIRVWSTMQNPFDFSKIWVSSMILLSISKGNSNILLNGLGYIILLMTRVRTAWYTWFLSFLFLASSLKQDKQIRIIISFAIVIVIVVPLIFTSSFSSTIVERLETMIDIGNDNSFEVRFFETAKMVNYALSHFLGVGLLGTSAVSVYGSDILFHSVDNGYVTLFVSLGWSGIIPYLTGLALIFAKLYQSNAMRSDIFLVASRAIATGAFLAVLTTHISHGAGALNLWGFLGIAMAGNKYHIYQRYRQDNRALKPSNLQNKSTPHPIV